MHDVFEARLVERFRQGDARAMETLFELYADRALGLAMRLTETREDAEEVAQEAFVRAFRSARQLTGGHTKRFGPWLFAIVRSIAADKRRQLRLPTLSLETPAGAALVSRVRTEDEALARAERKALLDALESLPEEHKLVLTLCDLEDIPHAEAAEVLGRSVAATKSLLYRARRALRDALVAGG
ncbi:sigma-70 family RNA polymerase sigma factor [Armatimonas rosea]|uniref:RNA polymerase sigma-70 factor (ECF subfamily) n=1 Tax=Armatimonas rosea TaxID=685828 RepID=A0A7W9SV01_ARMRO|nr:RNA polymerase sigma-70 factor (ECF subfamily) [Armatimonas rosea]